MFSNSAFFEYAIFCFIIANVIAMGLSWDEQAGEQQHILDDANAVFTIVFLVEAIIKLVGYGLIKYFDSDWNK